MSHLGVPKTLFGIVLFVLGCGDSGPQQNSAQPSNGPVEAERNVEEGSVEHTADETTHEPRESDLGERALGPELAAADVVLPLAAGNTALILDLLVTRSCPLARAELEVEFESMPEGAIHIESPSRHSAEIGMRVLTTAHFIRRFGWRRMDGLFPARDQDIAGFWQVRLALRGANDCGGSCEEGASPMPPAVLRSGELRLWCETETRPVNQAFVETRPLLQERPRWRQGITTRALYRVPGACDADQVRITGVGHPWPRLSLVTPSGQSLRVRPPRRGSTQDLMLPEGTSSAGIWELQERRAAQETNLSASELRFRCVR